MEQQHYTSFEKIRKVSVSILQKTSWIVFIFLVLSIGLMPFIIYYQKIPFGIETLKSQTVLRNVFWKVCFHIHIVFGAISLLIGWLQFIPKLRARKMTWHRNVGKVYMVSVLISGLAGYLICFYANGGASAFLALSSIMTLWLYTTIMSYVHIKRGEVALHKKYILYSYTCTFSSITLRIWLPILTTYLGDFDKAYDIATWLAIIPNLIVTRYCFDRQG
jgi:uncharacterized membrane protein